MAVDILRECKEETLRTRAMNRANQNYYTFNYYIQLLTKMGLLEKRKPVNKRYKKDGRVKNLLITTEKGWELVRYHDAILNGFEEAQLELARAQVKELET